LESTKGIDWFIDIWRRELCKITIILPCILTELSPRNHLFFIMVAYPGHILESTKGILESTNGIEIKLGTYIDVN